MEQLEAVMTIREIQDLYYLSRAAIDYAISKRLVRFRRSGGTYLILAEDVEKRWGQPTITRNEYRKVVGNG